MDPNADRTMNSRRERTRVQPPLIPGLPDDVAMGCLIRVPRVEHRKLRLVCRRWYHLLRGNDFYSLRRNLGLAEGWLYVIKRNCDGRNSWHAFDPTYQLWQLLPPLPRVYSLVCDFGCAVLSGCDLYLFGGRDLQGQCTRQVVFYSPRTNRWRKAPAMLRERHLFGFCVINNCIYVAGGKCDGSNTLSAEMYDPSQNEWSFISDMNWTMERLTGVVCDGKWFLEGLGTQGEIKREAYCPVTNTWAPVHSGLVAGCQNRSISFNGELYKLGCLDGCKLWIYDRASDSWNRFMDGNLHSGSFSGTGATAFAAQPAALVPLNGKLCIVRNNMSISLVDVSSPHWQMKTTPRLERSTFARGHFRTQGTSWWFNIAGQSADRSCVVHCQVLQA